jgi:hypothetical protein
MGEYMSEEKGVKELLELVAGLKEVGLVGKAALKDGKIDMNDLGLLVALLPKQQVLLDAFQGLADLDDEIKDLSLDEAMQVIQAILLAAKAVKEA